MYIGPISYREQKSPHFYPGVIYQIKTEDGIVTFSPNPLNTLSELLFLLYSPLEVNFTRNAYLNAKLKKSLILMALLI